MLTAFAYTNQCHYVCVNPGVFIIMVSFDLWQTILPFSYSRDIKFSFKMNLS